MPGWLKDFFSFNNTERTGILSLLVVILIIAFLPRFFANYRQPESIDFTLFEKDIAAFEEGLKADSLASRKQPEIDFERVDHSVAENRLKPIPFNPNELTSEGWKQLGLKDWQIKTILNYRSKGGKFRKKEDLKKIYGLTVAEYEILEPFVRVPEEIADTEKPVLKTDKPHYKQIIVDLNTADSVTLLELKGIGPSFARRIIKYRDILGGFYSVSQLMEVYGFDQQKYDLVAPNCITGNGPGKKINMNSVSTAELKKHPYFDFYSAKAIVDRRITKGRYTSVLQIKELQQISPEMFEKVKHYLSLE
jgi:DNA uptake protein ComE-like DNA-binding protein